MEQRTATYRAAVKLAIALSALAVAVAIIIETTTDVSQTTLVLAVIVIGFVSSFVLTERVAKAPALRPIAVRSAGHRVTVLPARHHVA